MTPSLPLVLQTADLPVAELHAARLDGDVGRLADGFCCADLRAGPALRAAALAPLVPAGLIAERRTAAWLHGADPVYPRPLQLCIRSAERVRFTESPDREVRQVVLADDERERAGPVTVTTWLRTAIDLLRWEPRFGRGLAVVVGTLLLAEADGVSRCRGRLGPGTSLPHKHRATERLDAVERLLQRPLSRR